MLLYGCDNRKDYFEAHDSAPILKVFLHGQQVNDSVLVDSTKLGYSYQLSYDISDEESLTAKVVCSNTQEAILVKNDLITISGIQSGVENVNISATDSYGKFSKFTLQLTVFSNLPPVANMVVTKIGASSPYEYEVDASSSFDQDARFGGHIVLYEYTFQTYTFTSDLSSVRYVFGSSGQKLITVRVKDDNGAWSPLKSQYVLL